MPNSFQLGSWLVYLNGIESPAESVTVQTGTFSFPTATIALAPDKELLRIGAEDRLQVAVFYLDTHATAQEGGSPEYRLLFEGEVYAWSYQTNHAGRSVVLQAVNHAAMLSYIRPSLMSSVAQIAEGAGADAAAVSVAQYPMGALFYNGLNPAGEKFISRPFDFVENIFRMLFGKSRIDKSSLFTSTAGAHFFARWARRTNFINRWAPSPLLETDDLKLAPEGVFPILKAVRGAETMKMLQQMSAELGGTESMWGFMTYLFQHMYYEFTLLPNMPLVEYDLKTGKILGPPQYAYYSAAANAAARKLKDLREKLRTRMSPEEASKLRTRLEVLSASPEGGNRQAEIDAITAKLTYSDADEDYDALKREVARLELAYETAKVEAENNVRGRGPADPMRPLRLLNYVTKPQLQYCAVPRCNVILPSMVTDYSYSEDYASQPTRLYVNDDLWQNIHGGGPESVISKLQLLRAGYPKQVRNFLAKTTANVALSDKNFLIFPEEYYKGPVIHRTVTPEWFSLFATAISARVQAASEQGAAADGGDAARTALSSVLDTYSEYEFHKIRGSARSGNVAMRFNPYVVPGFPAVVLDNELTNVHIYCYVQNVTHVLTSNTMSTSMSYMFAQTFDEFFSTYAKQTIEDSTVNTISEKYDNAKTALADARAQLSRDSNLNNLRQYESARDNLVAAAKSGLSQVYGGASVDPAAIDYYEKLLAAVDDIEKAKLKATDRSGAEKFEQLERALRSPDMVPAHPIADIRIRFQNIDNAHEYYADLFQQGNRSRQAVFDWRSMLGVLNARRPSAPPEPLTADKLQEIDAERLFGLREPYRQLAKDPESAMRYVSRPIVSLDEYIDFHGDLGVREGEEYTEGQRYYAKIMDYTAGPGEDPGEDENGYPNTAVLNDTRRDWEVRLKRYRTKMRAKKFFRS